MATTEDVARLILESDTQGFIDAEKKILSTRAALDKLSHDYRSGVIGMDEYIKEGKKLQGELDDITVAYKQAGDAAKKFGSAAAAAKALSDATGRAKNNMAGLGQAGLQTGRVIQDFAQGGVAGVINNIEGLIQAVGGGPGLAGALTILGTAFFVLKPVIAGFMESLDSGKPKAFADAVATLQNRIKELEANPLKMAVDIRELDVAKDKLQKLQAAQQAFNELGKGQSEFEKESGEQVKNILGTMPMADSKKLQADLRRNMLNQLLANDPTIQGVGKAEAQAQADMNKADARMSSATSQGAQMQAIQAKEDAKKRLEEAREAAKKQRGVLATEAETKIGEISGEAGRGSALDQKRFADLVRGAGRGDIAQQVMASSPAAMKAKADAVQMAKFQEAMQKQVADQAKADEATAKQAEAERIRQANDAARALEQDPTIKAQLEANRKKFGDFRDIGGGGGEEARAKAQQIKAQAEGAKADRRALNPEALAAAEETQRIMNENLGISRAMASRIQQIEANNRQLAQAARQLNRQVRMPGQPNLNMGHQ